MIESLRSRFHESIFFKFFLVFVLTSAVVFLLIIGFFQLLMRLHNESENPVRKNMDNYLSYIIRDIGDPPRVERAREIAKTMFLDIRYQGPEGAWSTSSKLPSIDSVRTLGNQGPSRREGPYILMPGAQGTFLFSMRLRPRLGPREGHHLTLLLLCLTCLFSGVWFLVRWILKPVRGLTEGVHQVSQGNFDYQIPVPNNDELGKLAESFNDMTRRIREMLHVKQQLLLDVSHETRTPLTRIKLALEFLPESKRKASIQSDLQELAQMLDEILESGRLNSPYGVLKLQPVDLAGVLRSVAGLYRRRKPGVKLSLENGSCLLTLDEDRIRKVLKNLMENALKYSSPRSKPVEVSLQVADSGVWVLVRDYGEGIPSQDLSYVFEPFYRADRSRSKETGGFGLGLSICKRIMEAHNGKIFLTSRIGEGTEVRLQFPKA
jgi:signal transduction histidine kinase